MSGAERKTRRGADTRFRDATRYESCDRGLQLRQWANVQQPIGQVMNILIKIDKTNNEPNNALQFILLRTIIDTKQELSPLCQSAEGPKHRLSIMNMFS
jgi:hypothetical protein